MGYSDREIVFLFDLLGYRTGYRARDRRFLVLVYSGSEEGSRNRSIKRSGYLAGCLVETPVLVYGGSEKGGAS